jgi:hypothetical protein
MRSVRRGRLVDEEGKSGDWRTLGDCEHGQELLMPEGYRCRSEG